MESGARSPRVPEPQSPRAQSPEPRALELRSSEGAVEETSEKNLKMSPETPEPGARSAVGEKSEKIFKMSPENPEPGVFFSVRCFFSPAVALRTGKTALLIASYKYYNVIITFYNVVIV